MVPTVTILIPLEGTPSVWRNWTTQAERRRHDDWLLAHPAQLALVRLAFDLAKERAA